MMLKLLLLSICITRATLAMTPQELNDDLPCNYIKLMPSGFSEAAKLASNEKFQEAAELLCASYENYKEERGYLGGFSFIMTAKGYKPLFDIDRISESFRENYKNYKKYLTRSIELHPDYSIKDYIYERFISEIWYHYYEQLPS